MMEVLVEVYICVWCLGWVSPLSLSVPISVCLFLYIAPLSLSAALSQSLSVCLVKSLPHLSLYLNLCLSVFLPACLSHWNHNGNKSLDLSVSFYPCVSVTLCLSGHRWVSGNPGCWWHWHLGWHSPRIMLSQVAQVGFELTMLGLECVWGVGVLTRLNHQYYILYLFREHRP